MKKIFVILIFILLFLTSCSEKSEVANFKKYYKTDIVLSGSISLDDSYVSYAKGIKESFISSELGGKLGTLKYKIGDHVNIGELLFSVSADEAQAAYSTALNMSQAINNLQNGTVVFYDDQIKVLEENLKKAELNMNGNKTNIEDVKRINDSNLELASNKIKSTEIALNTASIELEQTKNIYEGKIDNLYKNGETAITTALILYTNIIKYSDELLGVTDKNEYKNDNFEDLLGAKDRKVMSESKDKFKEVYTEFLEYKAFYNEKIENKTPTRDDIIIGMQKGESLATNMKELLKITYDVLDNSIESVGFSLDTINSKKQDILSFGNKVEQNILTASGNYIFGLKGTRQSLGEMQKDYEKQIKLLEEKVKLAEDSLNIAKLNYENIKISGSSEFNRANTTKVLSSSDIDSIKAQIKSLKSGRELKLSEIDINQKEIEGQQAKSGVMIDKTRIMAPFSGIIVKKYKESFEIIQAGEPVFELADNAQIKLNILVSDDILSRLKLGGVLTVYGTEKTFTGTLTNIAQSKNEVTKKTELEIIIDNKTKIIKVGDIMRIYFGDSQKEGLIIPNKAIVSDFMFPGVYVIKEETGKKKAVFTNVEVLSQNDSFSMIKGLKPGDEFITDGKENIYDGEEL